MMTNVLAWLLATLVTIPLIIFYLIYIITVKSTKNKKRSIKLAADVSTFFFIIAVHFIIYEIWKTSFIWFIMMVILLVAIIFTFIHWKTTEDIHFVKLMKGIWRFNFFLFFLAYLVLFMYGLISRIVDVV